MRKEKRITNSKLVSHHPTATHALTHTHIHTHRHLSSRDMYRSQGVRPCAVNAHTHTYKHTHTDAHTPDTQTHILTHLCSPEGVRLCAAAADASTVRGPAAAGLATGRSELLLGWR